MARIPDDLLVLDLRHSDGLVLVRMGRGPLRPVRRAGPAGAGVLLRLVHDNPFEYDVQRRVPDTEKAKNVLGFEAATRLDEMLDEVIAWIGEAIKNGTI